ncbi:hypothetical protein BUALT_Bualt18G0054800 [Buddleja alternifolia]|uniref:Reverse transcriptase zinc-binding domain-containing protein n=1 Tax=Buddleja alternifolia TaxID=168488 RepID=A0AAV6W3H7_9LAMI|nr:hypothetical protein BUALT_Bualt18G0054800 [Buddleja alternifolia]
MDGSGKPIDLRSWKQIPKFRVLIHSSVLYHVDITEVLPNIHAYRDDSIAWKLTKNGLFSTKSVSELLRLRGTPKEWSNLLRGPGKISEHGFILWLAIRGKLSTKDKSWIGISNTSCMLYDTSVIESHDHLFFECLYSSQCISSLRQQVKFQWLNIPWQQGERNVRLFTVKVTNSRIMALHALDIVRTRIISLRLKE